MADFYSGLGTISAAARATGWPVSALSSSSHALPLLCGDQQQDPPPVCVLHIFVTQPCLWCGCALYQYMHLALCMSLCVQYPRYRALGCCSPLPRGANPWWRPPFLLGRPGLSNPAQKQRTGAVLLFKHTQLPVGHTAMCMLTVYLRALLLQVAYGVDRDPNCQSTFYQNFHGSDDVRFNPGDYPRPDALFYKMTVSARQQLSPGVSITQVTGS
jgi:hypothetical protein